jgi:hypothetical protein
MASSGKKTTSTKRAREHQLRERRAEKQAKKAARRLASAERQDHLGVEGSTSGPDGERAELREGGSSDES